MEMQTVVKLLRGLIDEPEATLGKIPCEFRDELNLQSTLDGATANTEALIRLTKYLLDRPEVSVTDDVIEKSVVQDDSDVTTGRYFGYISMTEHYKSTVSNLGLYCDKYNFDFNRVIQETKSNSAKWKERTLGELLRNHLQAGDNLVVLSGFSLCADEDQVEDFIISAARKGVNLHFIAHNYLMIAKFANRGSIKEAVEKIKTEFVTLRQE